MPSLATRLAIQKIQVEVAQQQAAEAQSAAESAQVVAETALSAVPSASQDYTNGLTGSVYAAFSPGITVDSGAAGQIKATLVGTYDYGFSKTFRGQFKIQISPAGMGVWADMAGAEALGSIATLATDGSIATSGTETGLTPSTSYDVRGLYRKASGDSIATSGCSISLVAVAVN